jgi:uncharacterized protein YmfQ (DUF2313 family)
MAVSDPLAVFSSGVMTTVALSEDTPADLLGEVPPFERTAYEVQAVLQVVANELFRLEQARQAVILNFLPSTADALLPMFEQLLGLPVDPPGLTLASRQQLVLATMRRLKGQGRGLDWEATITALFGTSWSYQEYNPAATVTANFVPNPSFEKDTVGSAPAVWASRVNFNSAGGALTCQAQAQAGSKGMQVVAPSGGAVGAEVPLSGTFTSGEPYTFSVWLKGNAGGERVVLLFGSASDVVQGANLTLTTTWTRYSVTWTPTANRTGVSAGFQTTTSSAVTVFADSAMVSQAAAMGPYVDGDTSGYSWAGTPGQSATMQASGPPPNTVSIRIPQAYGGFGWPFIRDLTPAHLAITEGYSDGFFVGITNIGGTL